MGRTDGMGVFTVENHGYHGEVNIKTTEKPQKNL
jgi:hypothetical protein